MEGGRSWGWGSGDIHVVSAAAREVVVAEVVGIEKPNVVVCPWGEEFVAFEALVDIDLYHELVRTAEV